MTTTSGPPSALHCFSEEFQCCLAVSSLGYITFKHLTFVINALTPEVMRLSVDLLHERGIEIQVPLKQFEYDRIDTDPMFASEISAANIGPNLFHQNRTVFVADLNASFVTEDLRTLRSESGKRTYSITAKRMISRARFKVPGMGSVLSYQAPRPQSGIEISQKSNEALRRARSSCDG